MNRVHDLTPARAIHRAKLMIPQRILDLTRCEFVVGVDPHLAGIHEADFSQYNESGYSLDEDLSYKDCAHCVWGHNQPHRPVSDRTTKIVLPSNRDYDWDGEYGIQTVIHELGHALDGTLGFIHETTPVSDYAATNREEAFAEAFTSWIWGESENYWGPPDKKTIALFEKLALN